MAKRALLIALLFLAAACNSTNHLGASGDTIDGVDVATTEDGKRRAATDDLTPAQRAARRDAATVGEQGADGGAGPQGGETAPGTDGGPSGGTLRIGVHLSANAAAASTFGVPLPTHSPEKVDAIIRWINANGGIAGRKVEAVYQTTDPLSGSFDQQAQQTCATFTEDEDVDLVISAAQLYRDSLPACFAKAQMPFIWNVYFLTQRSVAPPQFLYRPAQMHADRLDVVVDGLAKHGFFKGAKIGLVRYDSAKHKAVADTVFKPALARYGLKVTEEAGLREPDGASGVGESASHASSIALRFASAGITHVLFVPSGGAIPLLFLAASESQSYRPAYGFSSADAPYFVRDSTTPAQLQKAVGVGWAPPADLGPDSPSAQTFSPGMKRCVEIARAAGFPADEAPTTYCDMLFFLRKALEGATDVNAATLQAGTVAKASGYESSVTLGSRFAPGRHDGAAQARTFVWDGNWKYVGSPYVAD